MDKKGRMNKRWEFLSNFINKNKWTTGAEIGVWKGRMAEYVLKNSPTITSYYCVDLWDFYDQYWNSLNPNGDFIQNDMNKVYQEFLKRTYPWKEKTITLIEDSAEAAKKIPEHCLDFCFIDGNHTYEYVRADIRAWYNKVKVGGLICGHDYGTSKDRYNGVDLAVNEFFNKKDIITKKDSTWWVWKK